ncbi:MAG: butyrate kinase [Erysipelotrichaceae bacterium]
MSLILVLNLGSTSTKVAIYQDLDCLLTHTIRHSSEEIAQFDQTLDQVDFRRELIEAWINQQSHKMDDIDLFCVRGGILKPIPGGIFRVTSKVIEDIHSEIYGSHVSGVGLCIGYDWSKRYNKEAIFLNSPSTDELDDVARITGIKGVFRRSGFHALNQKQMAWQFADSIHKTEKDLNLIICHLGGGISIGAHHHGRVIDVSNGLDGEGPFSPERAGALPNFEVLNLVEKYQGDLKAIKKLLVGQGGLVSHFNTNNLAEVMVMTRTDPNVKLIVDAMAYQIAKEVGVMATVLKGQVDQIIITGGLAYNQDFIDLITPRIEWIASVTLYPGENELFALASGAYRYLSHSEELKEY